MKKMIAFLLTATMLLALTACVGEAPAPSQSTPPAASPTSGTAASPAPETPAPEADPTAAPAASDELRPLSLQKQFCGLYYREDDRLLLSNEYSHVTLWQEDAAKYPALAETLEQQAAMVRLSNEEVYDSLCDFFKEESAEYKNNLMTWESTLDIQVRRADSVVLSLLSDSYTDYGFIEEYRVMHGTNYDAQTGQELELDDVIRDMSPILSLVTAALNSRTWMGISCGEDVVADYFSRTSEDGISWTLDYNGITFYFNEPGDLTEDGVSTCVSIPFAGHEELFYEKYLEVPDAYAVELPPDLSFFSDFDGDGRLDELVTAYTKDESYADESSAEGYTGFGIYMGNDGSFYFEDLFAYGFQTYYIKTAEGRHYLYLFCREDDEYPPMFTLRVYDLSGGIVTNVGKMYASPAYIAEDTYRVPTDPEHLYLCDFDSAEQEIAPFAVGQAGIPEAK